MYGHRESVVKWSDVFTTGQTGLSWQQTLGVTHFITFLFSFCWKCLLLLSIHCENWHLL